jgi:hypothetical protein
MSANLLNFSTNISYTSKKAVNHLFQPFLLSLVIIFLLPLAAGAEGFKFKIRNTTKNNISVFYKITKKSGEFKVKALMKMMAGEEKIKEVSVSKGDTISFYGQDNEDQTSVTVKKDFETLKQNRKTLFDIPILIPVKQNSNFESLEDLSQQLQRNKVLNFLLKLDSSSMSSMSMLENNFQNIYPLGTFLFVDTKTNQLLIPPLEPSFWNSSENYLTIQDSLFTLVTNAHSGSANVQVAYFVAKMFDSLGVNNTAELDFKAQLSLIRWRPTPTANIYQVFNDRSVEDFMKNCYALINNPDVDFQRYRLYFLTSYERIDNMTIYGKKFYNYANSGGVGISSNPAFQLFSTNLGLMYTNSRTMSNYYSIQGAVLRTRAYDFTPMLFNNFKNSLKNKVISQTYASQHSVEMAIVGEYKNLVAYNPDPVKLSLAPLTNADTSINLTPIITTVSNLSAYAPERPDTAKTPAAAVNNDKIAGFNNRVMIFNSHLKEINTLIAELAQINSDLVKLSQSKNDKTYSATANASGFLNEVEISNKVIRKQ